MLSEPGTKYNITVDALLFLVLAGEAEVSLTIPTFIAILLAISKRAMLLR